MLSNKNQKYIFERLLKGFPVLYQPLDEDRFVFTDGVRLFIFSKEQIKFDVTKCAASDKLKEILRDAMNGTEFKPSEEIRANDRKSKTYRKLTATDTYNSVWIEDKFVKDYNSCIFIYNPDTYKKKPVCVLDDYGELLSAIMPCVIDGNSEAEE